MKKHLKAALAALAEARYELEQTELATLDSSSQMADQLLSSELVRSRWHVGQALESAARIIARARELEAEGRAVKALP